MAPIDAEQPPSGPPASGDPPRTNEWLLHAACRGSEPEIFMDTEGGTPARTDWSEAAAYCEQCEVAAECLAAAVEDMDYWSYRGGKTPGERLWMLLPERMASDEAITASVPARPALPRSVDGAGHSAWRRKHEKAGSALRALRAGRNSLRRVACARCGAEFVTPHPTRIVCPDCTANSERRTKRSSRRPGV